MMTFGRQRNWLRSKDSFFETRVGQEANQALPGETDDCGSNVDGVVRTESTGLWKKKGLVDVFSRPRPTPSKPHPGCSPNTPSTPYLWTGLGWTNFGGLFADEAPIHPLCVLNPPNHAAAQAFGLPCLRGRPSMPS